MMPQSSLRPESVVLTSPHLRARRRSGGALQIDTPQAILTYGPEHAQTAQDWFIAAERPTKVARLVRPNGMDWAVCSALIGHAVEADALRDVSNIFEAQTSQDQLAAYYLLCDEWALEIFLDPFWKTVLSGCATTRLMLGWCEQFYHRTVGADEHNAIAVMHCGLPAVAADLTTHFREEKGHGEIFLRGLEEAGVSRDTVLKRPPLPSTRTLVEYFSRLGLTDTLAYIACYGVLHSPRDGQTLKAVRNQFAMLAAAYPDAAPAIRRVGQHAEIDVVAGHDQIVFEPYLLSRIPLDFDEVRRVLCAVRGTVAVFNRFFEGILEAYGEASNVSTA